LLIETHPLTVAQFIDPASAVFDVHENVVAAASGLIKPKPRSALKNFTVPVAMLAPCGSLGDSRFAWLGGRRMLSQQRKRSSQVLPRSVPGRCASKIFKFVTSG
jgi:hypothetical protein